MAARVILSLPPSRLTPALLAAMVLLSACGGSSDPQNPRMGSATGGHRGGSGGTPIVGYVVVQQSSAPIDVELPGRVTAYQIADVRPQVNGVILHRLFKEGSLVRRGQTLYQIDPSIYEAASAQAQANLQSARAQAEAAKTLAARYKPLVAEQAISKQDYTNAVAQARQAEASVAQNKAALHTAQINVGFTRVPAPIGGRIGLSNFTAGALVTSGQTQALTTITRLDPIYVDIQQSAAQLLALRQQLAHGGAVPTKAVVRLVLPDGSNYASTGSVEFANVVVDQTTGAVTIRATFSNSQAVLLPGMFVKANFAQALDTSAFLVPQGALSRDPQGNATVWIVGPNNSAVQRRVTADRAQGQYWIVIDGLSPGDKIITQGTAKLTPGMKIKPVPQNASQMVQAPPPEVLKRMNANRRGGGSR